jgi:dienelactone hydrolase
VQTVEYAPDRLADLFVTGGQPTVLLWHGMQTDSRGAVRALAGLLADQGLDVVVPDWDAHAADGGRADLLASVWLAREHANRPAELTVVGWSMGGAAAAGLAAHAEALDLQLAHVVCLAGAFMAPEPFTGRPLVEALDHTSRRAPFTLLHGTRDDVVPATVSRDFAGTLRRHDWPVDFEELDTDHAAIAGAAHDAAADRYHAADDHDTLAVAADVARRIAAAARQSA